MPQAAFGRAARTLRRSVRAAVARLGSELSAARQRAACAYEVMVTRGTSRFGTDRSSAAPPSGR